MKIDPVQIIGHQGCGKTTLMLEMIKELTDKGFEVGTIKHSAHHHELDKPGKDSYLQRKAGANPAAMMTRDMAAIYLPRGKNLSPRDLIHKYFTGTDIVLIEGWISGPYDKIEVYRDSCNRKPLFHDIFNVKVIITDNILSKNDIETAKTGKIQIFPPTDIIQIIDFILSR